MTIPIDITIKKIKNYIEKPDFFSQLESNKELPNYNIFGSLNQYNSFLNWLFEQLRSQEFLLELITEEEILEKIFLLIEDHKCKRNDDGTSKSFLLSLLESLKKKLWEHQVKLFVYGTLKVGERNHLIMKSAEFLREDVVEDSDLFDLGNYPMLVPGKSAVYGEVYSIPLTTLIILDKLEENPNYYQRHWRHLKSRDYALIYEGDAEKVKNGSLILNGRWSGRKK